MERVRTAYGRIADQYIELFASCGAVHPADLDLIGRHLGARGGAVIDVGCGPGHLTDHLCSLGADATGVDLVPEFLDHARSTYPGGRFGLATFAELPLPDASVAGLLAWYSLIHVPPDAIDRVLTELRRVVAADGVLVVGFFADGEVRPFEHKVATAHAWPVDELSARLALAGFSEVERQQRAAEPAPGPRAHGALVALAT